MALEVKSKYLAAAR